MLFKDLSFTRAATSRPLIALSRGFICVPLFILCVSGLHSAPVEITQLYINEATGNTASDDPGNAGNDTPANIATANEAGAAVVIIDPPVISGISVSSITAGSAVINWTTDVPASSRIKYDTTTAYGLSTLVDSTLVVSHSMILDGLIPGKLYRYQIHSAGINGMLAISTGNTFTTANLSSSPGSLNGRSVLAYPAGKIIPWTPNPTEGYSTVMALSWNYLLNSVPNDPATGKPAYYSRSFLDPSTTTMVNWPHNPAGTYAMLVESALKYYSYSGDANVMQLAVNVALWHLDHGMTLANDDWSAVPYSSGDAGSLNYGGAAAGNANGQGDGVGYLQPDKIGELGYAWLQLYKYNGNVRFRDAAIQAANVLSNKIRAGTQIQSPWPFRVNAHTGDVREEYCSNIIGPVSLLDDLIASGIGDVAAYQAARNAAWNWMMTYPMVNNAWAQYFEDVGIQVAYNSNLNQYNAMMVARYLLEHPETDSNWETHVRGLISWVESIFGQTSFGATSIKEQTPVFAFAMGSHTSRYASVNALLYEKTGDLTAKEKAYRAFNWATYMAKNNGVVIDGPEVNTQWFTDGYGDYVRHFMTGMAAVPEWSPANQAHLLRSSSVIKNISYTTNNVIYTTYDQSATDVLHINFNPVTVTANGVLLPQRSDLSQPGWTLDVATKTLRIYHTDATQINISSAASPVFINSICPGSNSYFVMQKPGSDYDYQWQVNSTGTGFADLQNNFFYAGVNSDTLRLNTPSTSNSGFTYRCIASKNGVSFSGTTYVLKFLVTWQGTISNAWANPANWSCNYVPDPFTDVIISGLLVNQPVINGYSAANSISISPGMVLTINPGVRLDIKGK